MSLMVSRMIVIDILGVGIVRQGHPAPMPPPAHAVGSFVVTHWGTMKRMGEIVRVGFGPYGDKYRVKFPYHNGRAGGGHVGRQVALHSCYTGAYEALAERRLVLGCEGGGAVNDQGRGAFSSEFRPPHSVCHLWEPGFFGVLAGLLLLLRVFVGFLRVFTSKS